MSKSTINKTVFFNATRETVWAYLTEKDKLGMWFHPPKKNLTEGEAYELMRTYDDGQKKKVCWGTVLEMNPHEKMVWTFTVSPLNGSLTTVTWTLEEVLCGTRLTLKHEGIEAAAGEAAMGMLTALDAGWDEHFDNWRKAIA
ncbi:SRPBCC family protein [Kiloniella antarctica]|uniref:SRPBCC domain-containing protein n=1 Tax=Kiloniella antarctica TaxID=1550907 RepID=A0ABW5BJF7_9PROT